MLARHRTTVVRAALGSLLALGILGAETAAVAQNAGKARVGFLGPRSRSDGAKFADSFVQGLRELGWVEGKNLVIEYRFAEGQLDRLPGLAAELVRLKVDVLLAPNTPPAIALKKATGTIPIVMATSANPVALGLVTSLARPGGNVTGLSFDVDLQVVGKELELLKETVPKARRIAVLWNPGNPGNQVAIDIVKATGRTLGVQLQIVEARGPTDFESALAAMARERAEALLVVPDGMFGMHRASLQQLVAKRRLPAMFGGREHVESGGLMSYAVDIHDSFRRAATYVDKILRGAKPGDLPIEQPSKYELVINLKTAKALGLTIPQSILARADHVIQ